MPVASRCASPSSGACHADARVRCFALRVRDCDMSPDFEGKDAPAQQCMRERFGHSSGRSPAWYRHARP